jgi:hypothetical protein
MNEQKGLLTRLGEMLDQYRAERRVAAQEQMPSRHPGWLRTLLPTPGNVLFTLLVVAGLIWANSVGALPLRAPAAAGTSTGTIAYQGRLADADGNPITNTVNMEFRLYDVASGGVPLWEEQWTGSNGVQVSDGLFNVMLGSLTPIPQSVITGHDSLFLGITVGTDDEMTPRVQLGSVPFAVQALTVPDGSVTTEKIADEAVTQAKLGADVSLEPPDGSITSAKIADDSVDDRHLNLSTSEAHFGANTGITAASSPGQTLLSLSDLAAGTYIIYGLAVGYVDPGADTHGGINFEINNGTSVVRAGPHFYFTEATGWQESQAAGFMFVVTLDTITTLNLAAYKGPGALTNAVAGGGTRFGYIKIGS